MMALSLLLWARSLVWYVIEQKLCDVLIRWSKQFIYRDADPGGAYALASLIMGCAVAALSAAMSHQDDAYKVIGKSVSLRTQ